VALHGEDVVGLVHLSLRSHNRDGSCEHWHTMYRESNERRLTTMRRALFAKGAMIGSFSSSLIWERSSSVSMALPLNETIGRVQEEE